LAFKLQWQEISRNWCMNDLLKSIVWFSLDNSRDISYHRWTFPKIVSKTIRSFSSLINSVFFLIIISFFINYLHPYNYLTFFSYSLTWIWKRKLTCLFMCMSFILIQIKFDIDINNDELLKTIWKHKKKKSWSLMVVHSKVKLKFCNNCISLSLIVELKTIQGTNFNNLIIYKFFHKSRKFFVTEHNKKIVTNEIVLIRAFNCFEQLP
jgi:hypothetical protein